ncbi:MAG: DUF1467 family protein [Azospirillaceae bacterium]|nr:DUF1467 family protein [Azospirillaceae bacterium]
MGVVSGIAVFVIVWWLVLFTVLPWGVQPAAEQDPAGRVGAPARPRIAWKMVATTIIAAIVWSVIDAVVLSGWISFREIAATM